MRKVFLDDLPRYDNRKGTINWKECINYNVNGIYNGMLFTIRIINYNIEKQLLTIIYNNKEYDIKTGNLINCNMGRILGVITKDFKVEIDTIIQDNKRDLIITNREYRKNKRIDKLGKESIANIKWYKYKCNICGYEGWSEESHLLGKQKNGCLCCSGKVVVEGINDIPTTAPWLIPYFQGGYEEAKLYTKTGGGNPNNPKGHICPICPDCGRIKDKKIRIADIYRKHSIGCYCSDNISYGEKFLIHILKQLKLDFKTQLNKTNFKWCKNFRYDFYFEYNNEQYIIETHGRQHYEQTGRKGARTLEEEQDNDRLKKEQALHNEIKEDNYIVIDCRKSELEWIRDNENGILNSKLNYIFNLNDIDWLKAEKFTTTNLIKEACELKRNNSKLRTGDIGKILKLNRGTISKYLSKGDKLRWCDYNADEEHLRSNKINAMNARRVCSIPLICIENEQLFVSATNCSQLSLNILGISISQTSISNSCKNKSKTKGYQFKYIDNLTTEEYIKYDIENKLKQLHNRELGQAC